MKTFHRLSLHKSSKSKSFNLFASCGNRIPHMVDHCNRETNMPCSSVKLIWQLRHLQGLSLLGRLWATDLYQEHIHLLL